MAAGVDRMSGRLHGPGLALGCAMLLASTAAGQRPSGVAATAPLTPITTRPTYSRIQQVSDDLVDESRRDVILLPSIPGETGQEQADRSVGSRKRVPADTPLLPEGYVVASREARIQRQGDWLVAELAKREGLPDSPPLRVLPNQQLSMLQAVMAQSSAPAGFLITGRITEFLGANYILIENIEEVLSGQTSEQAALPATATVEPESRPGEGPPVREPTAEEILKQLLSRPTRRSVALPQLTQVIPPESPNAASLPAANELQPRSAGTGLMPEHAMLVDRVGRVVPGERWWTLVFENRGEQAADRPIRLLPSRLLETAISLSKGGTQCTVFLVSGEVTTYENSNYLLLRKVLVRRQIGNIR